MSAELIRPQALLRKHAIRPSKRRGQNFLVNPQVAARIVDMAGFEADDIVIEVGAGLGVLTFPLAKRVKKVLSFEIDARLIEILHEEYSVPSNLEIIHQDILKVDFLPLRATYGQKVKIAGNLPYYASSPLLFKAWEGRSSFQDAFFMLQKEVADRILSAPGRKEYGILSVLLKYCANLEKIMDVSANQFYPRPEVDSVMLGIHFREPLTNATDEGFFKHIVRSAFQQRRKTLQNSLSSGTGFTPGQIAGVLQELGIDGKRRAETLDADEFVSISNTLGACRA
ncbi:MAG: 16S rRNA (adenine(1518)-N(6)/adenine(1519)-N(6))-dimethyltransferase RsmA [Pseudomonadota bacterium]